MPPTLQRTNIASLIRIIRMLAPRIPTIQTTLLNSRHHTALITHHKPNKARDNR
jgi:hypothetical protein